METKQKTKIWGLIVSILIPLAVGGLSALFTNGAMKTFDEDILKPPLSPPSILFPIVWTVLYILMGIAAFLAYNSRGSEKLVKAAMTVYALQLIFNFFWSIIFFNQKNYLFAFVWLMILWLLIALNIYLFSRLNKTAGYLLIPYIIWVTFAGYLNLAIYILN